MDKREELVKMLKESDEFNIFKGDIRSFQWLRTEGLNVLKEKGLGGGNLTIALIAVTQLDLLGQCYVLLSNQAKYTKVGINQTDAFWKLIKNNTDKKWGFNKKEILQFWKRVRHKLVHQSYPKAIIEVFQPDKPIPIERLVEEAKKQPQPFRIEGDIYIVNADILIECINQIKNHLISSLESAAFDEENINKTIRFIQNYEDDLPRP